MVRTGIGASLKWTIRISGTLLVRPMCSTQEASTVFIIALYHQCAFYFRSVALSSCHKKHFIPKLHKQSTTCRSMKNFIHFKQNFRRVTSLKVRWNRKLDEVGYNSGYDVFITLRSKPLLTAVSAPIQHAIQCRFVSYRLNHGDALLCSWTEGKPLSISFQISWGISYPNFWLTFAQFLEAVLEITFRFDRNSWSFSWRINSSWSIDSFNKSWCSRSYSHFVVILNKQ